MVTAAVVGAIVVVVAAAVVAADFWKHVDVGKSLLGSAWASMVLSLLEIVQELAAAVMEQSGQVFEKVVAPRSHCCSFRTQWRGSLRVLRLPFASSGSHETCPILPAFEPLEMPLMLDP